MMKPSISVRPGQALLFVCYGNTCRSPMAEGLARERVKHASRIESAGLSPGFPGAQPEAVAVMRDRYGVDIAAHKARALADLEIDRFDWIIILDRSVYEYLALRLHTLNDRLVLWDTADPFGRGIEAYQETAESLSRSLERHILPLPNRAKRRTRNR